MNDRERLDLVNKIVGEALAGAVERGELAGVDRYDHDKSDHTTYLVGRRGTGNWTITVEVDFI